MRNVYSHESLQNLKGDEKAEIILGKCSCTNFHMCEVQEPQTTL